MLDDLIITEDVGLLVRDIDVIAASKPNPQHDARHPGSLGPTPTGRHPPTQPRSLNAVSAGVSTIQGA
ncbi:hypothetical protein GCM10009744_33930 [Kribbella alba]|uniref:Uncharacterized protein n=1 Tax=Kribbella alba TaxID=190197 RepID=A0ABP4R8M0_9ACTN